MDIYKQMHMPLKAAVGKTVFKKQFFKNIAMNCADENLFSRVVDKIIWQYSLKWENCNIQPYTDEEREYPEIEVMEVVLREQYKIERLAELILRSIPYPVVLIFHYTNVYQLWLATYTKNKADTNKNVLNQLISVAWLQSNDTLWHHLSLQHLRTTNFYDTYSDMYNIVNCFRAATLVGHEVHVSGEIARVIQTKVVVIDERLAKLRGRLKKETQFNRKVELNMQIRKLCQEKEDILQKLN
ncbi:MAG: DUF4391 domain-containing protein [Megasphaera sp.]|jgi:hypothetical protein|nr:DUF4391 domain-containing protein [Megasphaera sp.]